MILQSLKDLKNLSKIEIKIIYKRIWTIKRKEKASGHNSEMRSRAETRIPCSYTGIKFISCLCLVGHGFRWLVGKARVKIKWGWRVDIVQWEATINEKFAHLEIVYVFFGTLSIVLVLCHFVREKEDNNIEGFDLVFGPIIKWI